MLQIPNIDRPFSTESINTFPGIEIGYHVFDNFNENRSLAWMRRALTGNSTPPKRQPKPYGLDMIFDPLYHIIVSANIWADYTDSLVKKERLDQIIYFPFKGNKFFKNQMR